MNLICLMPCRNEEWILGLSARAVLRWCDWLVALNHASTDRTGDILREVSRETGRVVIANQPDPVWREMDHRQSLLTIARQYDATHIVMVDADEVLTANLLPDIRRMFERAPVGCTIQVPWLQLRGGIDRVHIDGVWGGDSVASIGFRDLPEFCWTVQAGGYHFHHRHPMGRVFAPWLLQRHRRSGLMHLQMVSPRRLWAKQALYKMQEVVRWPDRSRVNVDRMYNLAVYGAESAQQARPFLFDVAPREWWAGYEDLMQYLDIDAEPWQLGECRRLMNEHGAEKFRGLDLFGMLEVA